MRVVAGDSFNGATGVVQRRVDEYALPAYWILLEDEQFFGEDELRPAEIKPQDDVVDHPSHYTQYKGVEVIQLTEQMNFNRGNAVKYIARAGLKDPAKTIEDLKKAAWYIEREINRLQDGDSA